MSEWISFDVCKPEPGRVIKIKGKFEADGVIGYVSESEPGVIEGTYYLIDKYWAYDEEQYSGLECPTLDCLQEER